MAKLVGAVKKDLDALISGIKDDIDKADTLLANFMAKHPKIVQKIKNAKIDGELETRQEIALEKMPELKPLTTNTPPDRPEKFKNLKTKTPPDRPKNIKDIAEKIDRRNRGGLTKGGHKDYRGTGMFYGGMVKKKGKK
jgi:hypothetical protein